MLEPHAQSDNIIVAAHKTTKNFFILNSSSYISDRNSVYLKIYFLGAPGSLIYNFGASIVRSTGDTKRPLYILSFSGLVNVILNLVLVVGFHFDVAGVAIATIAAQYLSAVAVLWILFSKKQEYKLSLKELVLHKELVGKMVFPPMPFGGQLTLVSMLPIVLVSYRHGVKWGLTTGLCYGFVQMALGAGTVTAAFQPGYFGDGAMIGKALLMCLMDYVLAYTALGLGGCFRGRLRKGPALMWGSLVALGARYLAHIFSGYILFSGWAEWFFTDVMPGLGASVLSTFSGFGLAAVYSVVYNGLYMIPEIVITAVAAAFVSAIPQIKKYD